MPLTIAHPLVVVPLRRLGVPLTALVVGSMVPDLPLFDGDPDFYPQYAATHSWPGVVIYDLPLGLVALLLWWYVVRAAAVDLAPRVVRRRLDPRRRPTRREWLWAVPSLLVGSATHLVWDDFTHDDRWGVRHIAWLQQRHGPEPGWQWAQYGSGIVGVAALVVLAVVWLRRQPVHEPETRARFGTPALVAVVAIVLGGAAVALAAVAGGDLHAKAYWMTVAAIATGVVAMVATGVVWQLAELSSPARRRG